MQEFRDRLEETARRVEDRTGLDPLDLRRSVAATADLRLERLPQSVGIGAGVMAVAVAAVCVGFLRSRTGSPGPLVIGVLVLFAIALGLAAAACVLVARAARSRRPENDRYEDAWARLAVEVWPAPRYQSVGAFSGSAASYSRTELLMALRDGAPLDRFARHAPFTKMP